MNFRRLRHIGVLLFAACMAAAPARAADPQPYTVTIAKTGSDNIDATLAASAQLVTLHGKVPVPPFALIERARSDIPRLQTALDSFGYYLNKVGITIGGHALTDPNLAAYLDTVPAGTSVSVDVAIDAGPLFHLGKVEIEGALPGADRTALGIKSGDPAIAGNVLDAQTRLLNALQEDGFALAKVDAPIAYADDAKHELNVSFKVDTGAQVEIGAISFKGLTDVHEGFARRAL
ncbi:MAG TPA: hypothetical protein VGM36_16430, partial [Rhizomicrobium sp.]